MSSIETLPEELITKVLDILYTNNDYDAIHKFSLTSKRHLYISTYYFRNLVNIKYGTSLYDDSPLIEIINFIKSYNKLISEEFDPRKYMEYVKYSDFSEECKMMLIGFYIYHKSYHLNQNIPINIQKDIKNLYQIYMLQWIEGNDKIKNMLLPLIHYPYEYSREKKSIVDHLSISTQKIYKFNTLIEIKNINIDSLRLKLKNISFKKEEFKILIEWLNEVIYELGTKFNWSEDYKWNTFKNTVLYFLNLLHRGNKSLRRGQFQLYIEICLFIVLNNRPYIIPEETHDFTIIQIKYYSDDTYTLEQIIYNLLLVTSYFIPVENLIEDKKNINQLSNFDYFLPK